MEKMEVLPDPKRMIEGLRDTGYEFKTAVADIIDNSIAATATVIDIVIIPDFKGDVHLSIADNGIGMNRNGLINAMKYGSSERPHPSSLGKFGLGLKTASTAFCRCLKVMTRDNGAAESLIMAYWDLDHVASCGKWELLMDKPDGEMKEHLEKIAPEGSGTVVVWSKVDRLMKNYADPTGGHAKKGLDRIVNSLKEHVSMVYQRFLDENDDRVKRIITIKINGENLKGWDPFCKKESELVAADEVSVEDSNANFSINAYVLPRKEEFSSKEAASEARLSNEMQGIYIYRENRLIHYADWLGMYTKEPHGTLLRVEFSFDHKLDDAFHIDIKKSKIILDENLYNWLKDEFLPAPRRAADSRYRQGQKKKALEKAENSHDSSNNNIRSKEDHVGGAEINVTNAENGECEVTNSKGKFTLKLKVGSAKKPGEVYVQPEESLDDGVLFEPAIIEGHKAVRINTSHPYYHKVYVPNLKSGVTIQGMDSLLWSICVAEYSTVDKNTIEHFEELRFELSRILRKLVVDLPEPDMDNETE